VREEARVLGIEPEPVVPSVIEVALEVRVQERIVFLDRERLAREVGDEDGSRAGLGPVRAGTCIVIPEARVQPLWICAVRIGAHVGVRPSLGSAFGAFNDIGHSIVAGSARS
jgi:hypothetical protein